MKLTAWIISVWALCGVLGLDVSPDEKAFRGGGLGLARPHPVGVAGVRNGTGERNSTGEGNGTGEKNGAELRNLDISTGLGVGILCVLFLA